MVVNTGSSITIEHRDPSVRYLEVETATVKNSAKAAQEGFHFAVQKLGEGEAGDSAIPVDTMVQGLRDRLAESRRDKEQLDGRLNALLKNARKRLDSIEQRYEEREKAQRQKHKDDLAAMKQRYEEREKAQRQQHKDDLAAMKQEMEKTVSDVRRDAAELYGMYEKDHEERMNALEAENNILRRKISRRQLRVSPRTPGASANVIPVRQAVRTDSAGEETSS